MYPVFHEMSEEKFADAVDGIIREGMLPVKLRRLRTACGLSQRVLSERSGVSIRAIQQYEQRQKNINHAQAFSVVSLARVLGCRAEDLMEYEGMAETAEKELID